MWLKYFGENTLSAANACNVGKMRPAIVLSRLQSSSKLQWRPFGASSYRSSATSGYYISTVPFFVISLLSAIIPLINIFFFKNLPLQKKMCLIECLFLVVVIVIAGYEGYSMISGGEVSWSTMIVAPFLALIATAMAYSRISADHRLLKSVDRLR